MAASIATAASPKGGVTCVAHPRQCVWLIHGTPHAAPRGRRPPTLLDERVLTRSLAPRQLSAVLACAFQSMMIEHEIVYLKSLLNLRSFVTATLQRRPRRASQRNAAASAIATAEHTAGDIGALECGHVPVVDASPCEPCRLHGRQATQETWQLEDQATFGTGKGSRGSRGGSGSLSARTRRRQGSTWRNR